MVIPYLVSFVVSFAVSGIGSLFSTRGLPWYYSSIKRPSWTPSGKTIGIVWTTLFTLTAVSAATIWIDRPANYHLFILLFTINGILNIGWSFVFFFLHRIRAAILVSILLALSVIAIIIPAAKFAPDAASLLVPYALWVLFATYLNFAIDRLNRN